MTGTQEQLIAELIEFLRIPSVSTAPEHAGDVRRCAEHVRGMLAAAGLQNATLIEAEGRHPLVYADWLGAGADKPTVLFYGHYDVQPADGEWVTPAFEPAIRNGNIYARGAADDKGQVFLQIKAVERLMRRGFYMGPLVMNWVAIAGGMDTPSLYSLANFVRAVPDGAVAAWQPPASPQGDLRHWLLAHALLAPNPHNLQPWLADLATPGQITLRLDP